MCGRSAGARRRGRVAGRAAVPPRMSATGREKVRTIGADGTSAESSAGRTSTCGPGPGGNQLTRTVAGRRSHVRGAPATSAVPALWAAVGGADRDDPPRGGQGHACRAPSRHLDRDDLHRPAEAHGDRRAGRGVDHRVDDERGRRPDRRLDRLVRPRSQPSHFERRTVASTAAAARREASPSGTTDPLGSATFTRRPDGTAPAPTPTCSPIPAIDTPASPFRPPRPAPRAR